MTYLQESGTVRHWVVQPWFYEGDEWPDSSGTPEVIEAESREAARAAFPAHKYTALNGLRVMTPEEWRVSPDGGYLLEGLDG